MENVHVHTQTKYLSKNPLIRRINQVYLDALASLVPDGVRSLIEIGCGEGILLRRLTQSVNGVRVVGLDLDRAGLEAARAQNRVPLLQGSITELPFGDNAFDLVICAEVLEHVADPHPALRELQRIARRWVILSVPNEPVWRIANMLRGKYLSDFGNTTGHIQHWTRGEFLTLVHGYFEPETVKTWLPLWSMTRALKRRP
jgi:ubiquinone/menaquinone biosynthesis C-methylase UbiE